MVLEDFAAENFAFQQENEVGMRASKLKILEENLNILKDEHYYKAGAEEQGLLKHQNPVRDFDFEYGDERKNLGINRDSPIFVKFDQNNIKINTVSASISQTIPALKDKMETVHLGSLKVSETMASLSKKDYKNFKRIRNQQNSLKVALYKIRPGHKFWVDVVLILFFIGMLSVMASLLNRP
mmetsp:Transcript_26551/g.26424  ORF Transcript_26551/g.26424 Transcript_26551/m.26424 type:complete len:182 (-) Transcript_26551:45-590(-)|eukprot:CAMPEP_0197013580 /NCGR_PEP_ID=MMETSP1380-20130617/66817_1 /TAXON_ID=5936 /ORGANISM="Euplotes crassus, Strain CT5" /LENGTH=181 /DNA_ID=CAMNT_0042437941 /DNA_START=275 /DNA_END=820 /DNA_ORIENTATION=-